MKVQKPVSGSLVVRGGYYHTLINAYVNGKRKVISRTTGLPEKNNYRRALKILEDRKKEYDEHGLAGMLSLEERNAAASTLLSDYMIAWIARKKNDISPVTFTGYNNMVNGRIRRFFDPRHITVANLTPAIMEDFLEWMTEEGCNSSTLQRYYQVIGGALKYAVKRDHIPRSPLEKVDRPKTAKFQASYYSPDESAKLLELAKTDVCYIPILLGMFYGLRRSEALGLQWSSIDFDANVIHIDHKAYTDKKRGRRKVIISSEMKTDTSRRTLPLIPFVREELLRHKARQEEYRKSFRGSYSRDWLDCVCVNPTGNIIDPDYLTAHFGQFLTEHGLRKIRFHDLRHSCASLLVAQGVPMKQIQLWLGHSNYSTTADVYSHLSTDALQESALCIGQLLAPENRGGEGL